MRKDRSVSFCQSLGFLADCEGLRLSWIYCHTHKHLTPYCSHCSFRLLNGLDRETESRYAYSCNIYSADSSFSPGAFKAHALLLSAIRKEDCNSLDMHDWSNNGLFAILMLAFVEITRSFTALSESEVSVIPGSPRELSKFDACNGNLIAPDHLITGLLKHLVGLCLDYIKSALTLRLLYPR